MLERLIQKFQHRRAHSEAIEHQKIIRLEAAERDVRDLRERGDRAVRFLTERQERNHWGEAIGQMIRGAF